MIKKYSLCCFLAAYCLFFARLAPVSLERVSSERVASKQELLHQKLSSAYTRRTLVYTLAALTATGLCVYYFWPNKQERAVGPALDPEALKQAQAKLLSDFCERENKKYTLWGAFEAGLTAGLAIALATVILDMLSRGSCASWNILQRFLGENDTAVFQNYGESLGARIGDLGRALEHFVRTIKVVYAQAQAEQSAGCRVSIDQVMSDTDKEFLCADILVAYRAFLDAIEDLIALVQESTHDIDSQSVLYKEAQKNVCALTGVASECAGYIETLVNNLDALGANKKATAQTFVFSKRLSTALSPSYGGLGKMLYGVS